MGKMREGKEGDLALPPHFRDLLEKLEVGCLIPSLHGETWGKEEREEGEVEFFLPYSGKCRASTRTRGMGRCGNPSLNPFPGKWGNISLGGGESFPPHRKWS
jgi:hypothetical protein